MIDSLLHFDHQLFAYINEIWTNPIFDFIMPILRNKLTWIPLYAVIFFILIYKDGKQAWKPILLIIIAVSFSDFMASQILKNNFERIRPCMVTENLDHIRLLIKCSNGYSFPSAHASNHACLAILFSILFSNYYPSKKVFFYILFSLWAISIAYAQVYVGVHYPLDVSAGILLGIAIGLMIYKLTNKKIFA